MTLHSWIPLHTRFEAQVLLCPITGCHFWTGRLSRGYGMIRANGKRIPAHRFSYELAKGPIPEGLQVDHLCKNKSCVNPDHLEAVTQAENTRRACKKIVCSKCGGPQNGPRCIPCRKKYMAAFHSKYRGSVVEG